MFDPTQFNPSKMDPKLLMELGSLIRTLPPEKLSRIQSLMHNMSAGFDVSKELEEFEKTLPPGFREKLVTLMMSQGMPTPATAHASPAPEAMPESIPENMDVREARLVILRAVADGSMTPEAAERLLFS